jgi:hypothetical protein
VFALTVSVSASYHAEPWRPSGGQMPTGHFYGKVVDAANKGVEAASVTLVTNRMDTVTKKMKETVVGGMLTDKSGNFSIDNVPLMGRYLLRVSGIGFKSVEKQVGFDMPNRDAMGSGDMSAMLNAIDKDLGNFKVEVDEKSLSNVTVTASRPALTLALTVRSSTWTAISVLPEERQLM